MNLVRVPSVPDDASHPTFLYRRYSMGIHGVDPERLNTSSEIFD